MIDIHVSTAWGRALAGLALSLCAAGCGNEAGSGPAPVTQDEEAALEDAAAMLDAREPAEPAPDEGTADSPRP